MELQKIKHELTFKEYVNLAGRTMQRLGIEMDRHHMNMGAITEIGELLDAYKKALIYKKELDTVNVQEEWADILWYLSNSLRLQVGYDNYLNVKSCMDFIGETDWVIKNNLSGVTNNNLEPNLMRNSILICIFLNDYLKTYKDNPQLSIPSLIKLGHKLGVNMNVAMTNNINKLIVRFPDKFDTYFALNRDLDSEREELSK